MGQPIGNTKCMILGEGAVVEHQNEMALAWPGPLDGMTPTAREIPNIARPERIGRCSVGAQYSGAATARHDVTQLGSSRVPMQFAQTTGLQAHRGAADALANRELPDRCAPHDTATVSARRLLFQAEAERWQRRVAHIFFSWPQYRNSPDVAVPRATAMAYRRSSELQGVPID